jgi:uncharacterized protein YkwD
MSFFRPILGFFRLRPRPPAVSPPIPSDSTDFPAELLRLHNEARAAHRPPLAPLAFHLILTRCAALQAADCASVDRLSHTGRDGSDPFSRMAREGWKGQCSENAAAGWPDIPPSFPGTAYGPGEVMESWLASPGHARNVFGNWSHFGAAMKTARNGSRYVVATYGKMGPGT